MLHLVYVKVQLNDHHNDNIADICDGKVKLQLL